MDWEPLEFFLSRVDLKLWVAVPVMVAMAEEDSREDDLGLLAMKN